MTDDEDATDPRALASRAARSVEAPNLPYRPPGPKRLKPRIGILGTGGIVDSHLEAYRSAGWEVAAIWNRTRSTAEAKAAAYFPGARVANDWRDIAGADDIDVIDATLHPVHRLEMIEAALRAGKHVLSQKPFAEDLDTAERLVRLADDCGVRLAVNQNGRWAPHFAWMREAVRAGLIGEVISAHLSVHWDHSWTAGTEFDRIEDLILFDFGVHWFDFLASILGPRATSILATTSRASGQKNRVPLLAQALIRLDGGQASLALDGAVATGARDQTVICGTAGMLTSQGPDLGQQIVTLTTAEGVAQPDLRGTWFNDGFRGTMGELLAAIEEDREPLNAAKGNLRSLAMAFAAVTSARTGREVEIGEARSLGGGSA